MSVDLPNATTATGVFIPSSEGDLLTASGTQTVLLEVNGANTNTANEVVKLYFVPSGATDDGRCMFYQATVKAGSSYQWQGRLCLAASGKIRGVTTTASKVSFIATINAST